MVGATVLQAAELVRAVEAIYAAAPDPPLWPHALQAIADVFGDVGAILIWRRDNGTFGTIVSATLTEAQADYERNGWSTHELRALRTAERGYFFSGEPFTDRHLCTPEEIRTDPAYTQFCAAHGLGWFGAVAVSPDPHVGVALSIQRNARRKPAYSDEELRTIGRIGRHVEESLRLSIRLLDAELAKVGLGEALARLGIGVFALDSVGRVLFANPAAERMAGDGLAIASDRLLVAASPERDALRQVVAQTISGAPADVAREPRPVLVRRRASERPLAVYVLPTTPAANAGDRAPRLQAGPAARQQEDQFRLSAHTGLLKDEFEPRSCRGVADPERLRRFAQRRSLEQANCQAYLRWREPKGRFQESLARQDETLLRSDRPYLSAGTSSRHLPFGGRRIRCAS
jgi:PAS domain-containing protein